MNKNRKKAFTIVELVIVIAIIAVLAAVLIPTFGSLIEKANQAADIQAASQMNMALAAASVTDAPESFKDVIRILSEYGYAAESELQPISRGHTFYWHKTYNQIVLVKDETSEGLGDAVVIFPTDDQEKTNVIKDSLTSPDIVYNLVDGAILVGRSDLEVAIILGENYVLPEGNNITFDAVIEVANGKTANIDLSGNEFVITENADIKVSGTLTISNGRIVTGAIEDESGYGGLVVEDGGNLTIDNVTVTSTTNSSNPAITCFDGGTATIKNSVISAEEGAGLKLIYNDGNMTISKTQIIVNASNGHGITNDGEISISDTVVTVAKASSVGIYSMRNGDACTITDTTINVTGASAQGIRGNGDLILTNSEIYVSGNSSQGMEIGNTATITGTTFNVIASGAQGIYCLPYGYTNEVAEITNSEFKITGDNAFGVNNVGISQTYTLTFSNSIFTVTGEAARGIYNLSKGIINVNSGSSITVSGKDAYGIDNHSKNYKDAYLNITGSNIIASGDAMCGVYNQGSYAYLSVSESSIITVKDSAKYGIYNWTGKCDISDDTTYDVADETKQSGFSDGDYLY